MKIGDMIESKYLKQSDIDGEVPVTIIALKKVNVARDDEDPDYRWTAKFAEFTKSMVLNVTNLKRIAKALGDDTEDWIGNQIMVYVDANIEFGGNIVGGLRVKAMRSKPTLPTKHANKSIDDINAEMDDGQPPF
jgi:hypothetical protein